MPFPERMNPEVWSKYGDWWIRIGSLVNHGLLWSSIGSQKNWLILLSLTSFLPWDVCLCVTSWEKKNWGLFEEGVETEHCVRLQTELNQGCVQCNVQSLCLQEFQCLSNILMFLKGQKKLYMGIFPLVSVMYQLTDVSAGFAFHWQRITSSVTPSNLRLSFS